MQRHIEEKLHHSTIVRYWRVSLGLGMVVIGAVAFLLTILDRTVTRIEGGAAEIWRVGKLIANNTVHVPLLIRTNQIVAEILPAADGIAQATGRIEQALSQTTES
ncbi:MAG: hypothetical protein NVS4B8_03710 [Herpetosiphon sp.]